MLLFLGASVMQPVTGDDVVKSASPSSNSPGRITRSSILNRQILNPSPISSFNPKDIAKENVANEKVDVPTSKANPKDIAKKVSEANPNVKVSEVAKEQDKEKVFKEKVAEVVNEKDKVAEVVKEKDKVAKDKVAEVVKEKDKVAEVENVDVAKDTEKVFKEKVAEVVNEKDKVAEVVKEKDKVAKGGMEKVADVQRSNPKAKLKVDVVKDKEKVAEVQKSKPKANPKPNVPRCITSAKPKVDVDLSSKKRKLSQEEDSRLGAKKSRGLAAKKVRTFDSDEVGSESLKFKRKKRSDEGNVKLVSSKFSFF